MSVQLRLLCDGSHLLVDPLKFGAWKVLRDAEESPDSWTSEHIRYHELNREENDKVDVACCWEGHGDWHEQQGHHSEELAEPAHHVVLRGGWVGEDVEELDHPDDNWENSCGVWL